ncbi:MAG: type II toxin-antitoxin system VapB family antitoxin [Egibacteraceae bacterium]
MAKEKTTITVDRAKIDEVQRLTGITSVSAAIDLALRELIRIERLRGDLAAYGALTVTDDEVALARTTPSWADLADDTDWDSLYADAG